MSKVIIILYSDQFFSRSTARVIISNRAGMGKSLYVRRLSQKLGKMMSLETPCLVTVPIHGPDVTADEIIDLLQPHVLDSHSKIYHFDIATSVSFKAVSLNAILIVW